MYNVFYGIITPVKLDSKIKLSNITSYLSKNFSTSTFQYGIEYKVQLTQSLNIT